MAHLPPLIHDLAVLLAAAAISTLLFSKLKQPLVLGYLIAGFLVGPHFPLLPTVVDTEGVKLWAEIGVVFLLFGLGLEFSFKKLAKVGKSAFIAALFEIVVMIALGYLVGRAFGWSTMDSIFLGAILSMSSTTIIIRAFDEAGLKGKAFVSLVFGILIVEDLMAILIMVVLASISVAGAFSAGNVAFLSGRLVFFLLLWFLVGIYVLPSFLRRVRQHLSDEIMLVVSIGLCFLMVVLATNTGFSAALGAFVMGSILAETHEGERIEHLLVPVKNLFAAVFFVSVGMMIDPTVLREHFWVVVLITLLTAVGKLFGSGFGAVLSGRSLKQSVQAGMSLAQIGEFSFIIATLGMTLGVTSDFLYPVVVAVSAVTTFTTPYMIRHSGTIYGWVEARLPRRFLDVMGRYERAMSANGEESALSLLGRIYGLSLLLNAVVVVAIGLAAGRFGLPLLIELFGDHDALRLLAAVATLGACSPFLLAIVFKAPKKISDEEAATLARLRSLQVGLALLRSVIGLALIATVVDQFSRSVLVPLVMLVAAPILMFALKGLINPFYASVERRFLQNLNAKELAEVESIAQVPQLAPWDATLTRVVLGADSKLAGHTLEEARFRSTTGATVAMVDRGRRRIFSPNRAERLLPGDQLYLIGTDEQLAAAQALMEASHPASTDTPDDLFSLESAIIDEASPYARKSIRESGMNEKTGALIVGIERGAQRILNPESTAVLEPGDLIWVFGRRDQIKALTRP